ncbi:hypothetical protein CYY_008452 [Polysphondylium violaceum]|uniref:Phosphatidylethanolamine-binding protein PEBP n=1 Tax=Polysphondylium violaceum TaxID=133409 RepID=A0A8J4V186_9MYCE|nr:hypothetical protein CYY_008452 [Polysphondylium violaceum]
MESLRKSLVDNEVAKDVLDFTPSKSLNICFDDKLTLETNATYTPTQVQNQPKITYDAKDDEYYTLIKTDPDAPTRADPKFGEWRHYLVVNIPGNKVEQGDCLSPYIGCGPPPNTGLHRYIYILCKQPSKIHFKGELRCHLNADGRNNWKAAEFIKKWNLEPVACDFFQAEYDSYVPTLYQTLSANQEKSVEIN